jgi:hypothetical protein
VTFSLGDVALLLTAPIAAADLVRPRLAQACVVAAVLGALTAGLATLVMAGGPAALGLLRSLAAVLGGACAGVALTSCSALVQGSRRAAGRVARAGPAVVLAGAGLAAAAGLSATGATASIWSGPWGWIVAPLAGTGAWPLATAALAIVSAALFVLARRAVAGASVEQFLVRAQTRAGIGAAAGTFDMRGAALARRGAFTAAAGRRVARRVPRPRRRALALPWRDALALVRDPARPVLAALLAAAATAEAVLHPGAALAAALAAFTLYCAASLLCEPLRLDVDSPDRSRVLLSAPFAQVLAAHTALPALLLGAACVLAVAALVAAGAATAAALGLALLAVAASGTAVGFAALAARRGGRIDARLLTTLLSTAAADPFGGASVVLLLAPWLLACVGVLAAMALILGHAVAHHRPLAGPALASGAVACAALAVVIKFVRASRAPQA